MGETKDTVKVGDYVVIQRQDFCKLHKVSENGSVSLGKDTIDISSIIGKQLWTTYRMEQKKGGKRSYSLQECKPNEIFSLNVPTVASGSDNRNICDDGSSQKLTMEEIVNLRDEGLSSKEILGALIENSKTFHSKTEYSQQKYLKKKEKKYFEYINIRKPSVRLIAEILYRQDPAKILGVRVDTLALIPSAVNLHSHGSYILFESGCQALPAAVLLNGLAADGRLIHIHPGQDAQKQAVNAMNLTDEQRNSYLTINIYNLLRKLRDESVVPQTESNSVIDACIKTEDATAEKFSQEVKCDISLGHSIKLEKTESTSETNPSEKVECDMGLVNAADLIAEKPVKQEISDPCFVNVCNIKKEKCSELVPSESSESSEKVDRQSSNQSKRKFSDHEEMQNKRQRRELDTEIAANILKSKVDGLVIVCREHPGAILQAFLPYVAPSRNFVVYCSLREPLQELLLELKQRPDVIYLRLTDTWLRNYQVDVNRTHPLVNMTGSGGFLLTGVVVEKPVD